VNAISAFSLARALSGQWKSPYGLGNYTLGLPLWAPPRVGIAAGRGASFFLQIKIYKILC
jgi:hypothetical protein